MARRVNPIKEKQRRSELVQAAYLAIYQHGYAFVTLSDIARAAGVSKGTLVYYFGSKEKLFEAVLRRFVRTIATSTRRALRQANSTDEKLRVFVENQFYGLANTRRFYTVYLDFLSASTKDATLRGVTRAFFEESRTLDLELARLTAGDAEARAWQLRALVDGLSIRFLYDPAPELEVYRETCLAGIRAVMGLEGSANTPVQEKAIVSYFRAHGATADEDIENLIEFVGDTPSRQVSILLHDGKGYSEERRKLYMNSSYDFSILTDALLSQFIFSESDRITRNEFEYAWIKSLQQLDKFAAYRKSKGNI